MPKVWGLDLGTNSFGWAVAEQTGGGYMLPDQGVVRDKGSEKPAALHRPVFFQRPLKSQKGTVGRCTFRIGKSRRPVSHPRFEEFRMLAFVNNIRVTAPGDVKPRPLTRQEAEAIRPLFLRKSKPHFDFEEIARKIAGMECCACKGDRDQTPRRFNFARTATATGCPVTAALISVFDEAWFSEIRPARLAEVRTLLRQAWNTTVSAWRSMQTIPEKTINNNKYMPGGIRL